MRVRRVGRLIGDPAKQKTAKQIADEIGQAMARNLNYNVLKEEAELQTEKEKKAEKKN